MTPSLNISYASSFHLICAKLGVPIAYDKTVKPTTDFTLLGVELEPVAMHMRFSTSKLPEARAKPWYFHKKNYKCRPR